jgi:NADPH-dependent glutamate synthase beta subunit-like oxidoreductase
MIRSGNVIGAAEVVKSDNPLANVCGKVCPEEEFCQGVCTQGKKEAPIAIRELHFYATQCEVRRGYSSPRPFPRNGRAVAVIGGGPAGLTCAFELAKFGYRIDLYDRNLPGGIPRNSIPSFRLTDGEVRADVDFLSRFIEFRHKNVHGKDLAAIQKEHDAVFLATGLTADRPLPLPGVDLEGVIPVLRFLETAKGMQASPPAGRRAVIIGGGNVSLDAAATAKRSGYEEVILAYRRGEKEMRVWKSELEEARSQGVQIQFFVIPVEILGRDRVTGIRCRRTRLSGIRDGTGRPVPVEIEGSEFVLDADAVISAIGQMPDEELPGLFDRTPQGYIQVDESFSTSRRGVFAGGDLVAGEGTVVQSVGQGKKAALGIHRYLSKGGGA